MEHTRQQRLQDKLNHAKEWLRWCKRHDRQQDIERWEKQIAEIRLTALIKNIHLEINH